LIFKKFLEDQRFIELLLERALLDSCARRVATRVLAGQGCTPSVTILGRITTTFASAVGASTRAVHKFCRAPVLPYAQLWAADFLVAQMTERQASRREELSIRDASSVDNTRRSDQWLRS
jgi:hypothetical protein